MANLTITAANVLSSLGTATPFGIAGVTITAGMVLYLDSGTNTLKAADANNVLTAAVVGIATSGGYAGNRVSYVAVDPTFTVGATVVPGVTYRLSETAGLIADTAAASTDYAVILGPAINTTQINLNVTIGGLKA